MLALLLAPVYIGLVYYLGKQVLHWMQTFHPAFGSKRFRILSGMVYGFTALTPLTAFLTSNGAIHRILKIWSNYWLGVLLYLNLVVGAVKAVEWIWKHSKLAKISWLNSKRAVVLRNLICFGILISIIAHGIVHPEVLYKTGYEITIEKSVPQRKPMKIVLVADLHVGYNTGTIMVHRVVKKINKCKPDLVVFAGDFYDNDFEAIREPEEVAKELRKIKSTYGVYGCWGNHDLEEAILAGFTFPKGEAFHEDPKLKEYMEECGIQLLEDEAVLLENDCYLIGRKDPARCKKLSQTRKTPEEIVKDLDHTKPIFVMDHQPSEYTELAKAGVDLDMSGHTHDGQMFPCNYLMKLIWKNPYGYKRFDGMHTVVTSGAGIWGPSMRVGTKSEIVEICVNFE